MRKAFVVLTGKGTADMRERVSSATEALRLVLAHMKLRRPGVRIEDEDGCPISFFQLKEMAEGEPRKENARAYSEILWV